jgi:hypothetical protein
VNKNSDFIVGALSASVILMFVGLLNIWWVGNEWYWGQLMLVLSAYFVGDFFYWLAKKVARRTGNHLIVVVVVFLGAILLASPVAYWVYVTLYQPNFSAVESSVPRVIYLSLAYSVPFFFELRKFSTEA